MQDLYVEQIVKAQPDKRLGMYQKLFMVLAAFFAAVGVLIYIPALLLFAVAAVAAWYLGTRQNLEYEYLFVNGQLDVDMVRANSRKRLVSLAMQEIECMTPLDSHRLEGYKGRLKKSIKAYTGASGAVVYAIIFKQEGQLVQIAIEPEEELLKAIRRSEPHKVLA